mgnify:CR=1 FL=1
MNVKELLKKCQRDRTAVLATNFYNFETLTAVMQAAQRMQAPVLLQLTRSSINYMGLEQAVGMGRRAIADYGVEGWIHLDHGGSVELVERCLDAGFDSVMIDASERPFDENVEETKKVVEYAHAHGVVVEAELGRLAGVEDDVNVSDADARFTDPEQAAEFVHLTGVDSLAIAIGTSHGAYKFKGNPYLDFDRLKKVGELLPNFPIVLHGASSVLPEFVAKCNEFGGNIPGAQGVPEEMLRKAAQMAVCKINIDTDLRLAMTASVREYLAQNPSEFDPRKYLGPARDAIKGMVAHKIKNVLGSSNKL